MRRAPSAVALLLLLSCVAAHAADIGYKQLLARNNSNLPHLAVGMTKAQVTELMTSDTTTLHGVQYSNPFRSDALQKDGAAYEVLHYLTRAHPPFTPIKESQATPVVLKDGVVIGWGVSALQSVR